MGMVKSIFIIIHSYLFKVATKSGCIKLALQCGNETNAVCGIPTITWQVGARRRSSSRCYFRSGPRRVCLSFSLDMFMIFRSLLEPRAAKAHMRQARQPLARADARQMFINRTFF